MAHPVPVLAPRPLACRLMFCNPPPLTICPFPDMPPEPLTQRLSLFRCLLSSWLQVEYDEGLEGTVCCSTGRLVWRAGPSGSAGAAGHAVAAPATAAQAGRSRRPNAGRSARAAAAATASAAAAASAVDGGRARVSAGAMRRSERDGERDGLQWRGWCKEKGMMRRHVVMGLQAGRVKGMERGMEEGATTGMSCSAS